MYVKPFSDRFPKARVYSCPGQWSWPINFPPSFRVDGVLCEGTRRKMKQIFQGVDCLLKAGLFLPHVGEEMDCFSLGIRRK